MMDSQLERLVDRDENPRRAAAPRKTLAARLRLPLLIGFPLLIALLGAADYVAEEPYISTDDAFVRTAKETVNARVAGQVIAIAVKDNEPVRKGQLLFRVDPEPYRIAVDQAAAQLDGARLKIAALRATYRQQLAELQAARAGADFDESDYLRKKALVASDFTSHASYERAETDLKIARQHVASITQQIANTVAALNGDPERDIELHPTVRAAKSALDRARLDLSYTEVTAPDDGIVTKVDDLQIGDYVTPGAAMFALLSSQRLWIEANFRETGLTRMRPGQQATIAIDAYPDTRFPAHIVSMSPGSGSDFAVVPPENATGNWVKVVQRLPVRLELDRPVPDLPLFSGISVTARVDTGYRRSWQHPFQRLQAVKVPK